MKTRNSTPLVLALVLIAILLVMVVVVASFALSLLRSSLTKPGIVPGMPSSTEPSENVKYEFGSVLPDWTGTERVNVLVLGIDERSQETGPFRTDTMMLITLDPVAKRGGALSIPRDLWVPIPGYKEGRINTAHFLGDLYDHPGNGPALAVETVEYNLGVPIDYYVRVNFQGFVNILNLIGGVDIYVENTINDPTYPNSGYGYEPLYIEAGWHHFDGEMALKYARTRHGSSDFDRARRQQQVMMAVLERVTSLELLPQLAGNLPQLYETVQSSVQTDLALDQMLALGNTAMKVDRADIRFGVIDQTCTQPWVTPDGAQVLVPLRDRMREVRSYVFFEDQPTPVPQQSTSGQSGAVPTLAPATATPEAATVAVMNGTTRAGFAGITAEYLKGNGINVVAVDNADRQDYATTVVILNRDKPATGTKIVQLLNIPVAALVHGTDANAAYDVVIVLGSDYAGPPQ
ncbi:MAG: LCP family protein [Anaerolineae bacterium]|nr:LCP family protein [Anaerolineae bacterium]